MYFEFFIIFLKSVATNFHAIFLIWLFFTLTSFVGIVYARFLFKEFSLLNITSGIVGGVFGFIFFLGILGHLFKGSDGILVILLLYVSSGLFLLAKKPVYFNIKKYGLKFFSLPNIFCIILSIFFIGLLFVTSGNNIFGGDVIAYWGFATSFANGNYPVYSLWQPNILATHHQGVFLYEGAVYALTNVNIQLVHSMFSFFIISAGFFLLWALVASQLEWKKTSILVSLVFYISFAGLFVILPKNSASFLDYEVKHSISRMPIMTDAKNRLGGSSNLNELFYINHRAAAFAGVFLIIALLLSPQIVSDKLRFLAVTVFLIPIISSDEVVLPSLALIGLGWWLRTFYIQDKKNRILLIKFSLSSCIALGVFFIIIGSALRDAILVPAVEPRFYILTDWSSILARLEAYGGAIIEIESNNIIFYLPNMFLFFSVASIISFYRKSFIILIVLLGVMGSVIATLLVEHTFYPGNFGRFLHLGYLLTAVAFIIGLLQLLESQKRIIKSFSLLCILLFLIPGLISSSVYLIRQAINNNYPNFKSELPNYPVLKWIQSNIANQRIIFIDGYLRNQPEPYLSFIAIEHYGLQVPLSPVYIKVHTPDIGVEFINAVLTLNPYYLRQLNVGYIYIKKDQIRFYSKETINNLQNQNYFEKVFVDREGVLYRILPDYLNHNFISEEVSLETLKNIVGKDNNIYIDTPPEIDQKLRSVFWLLLKADNKIYTEWNSGLFNYIETKTVIYPPSDDVKYQYIILGKSKKPDMICVCKVYQPIWELNGIVVYKID